MEASLERKQLADETEFDADSSPGAVQRARSNAGVNASHSCRVRVQCSC